MESLVDIPTDTYFNNQNIYSKKVIILYMYVKLWYKIEQVNYNIGYMFHCGGKTYIPNLLIHSIYNNL